MPCSTVTIE